MQRTSLNALVLFSVCSVLALFSACGGDASGPEIDSTPVPSADGSNNGGFPVELPQDIALPWDGQDSADARGVSAINEDSSFSAGVDYFSQGGVSSVSDRALSLTSGSAGSGELSYSIYRMEMGGEEPGAVSADINLKPRSDDSPSQYWLGLADYGGNRWDWRGPYTDSHVRVSLAGGTYLSELGNLFVAVAAFDGAAFDVVGIGANAVASGDTTAPPQPAAPQLTAVNGGLLLEWLPVAAGDLAGYRIYYRDSPFVDGLATGVKRVPYLEGLTRHLISGLNSRTYVRISAVDINGNESLLSPQENGTPLAGFPLDLQVSLDHSSAKIDDSVMLTASGGEVYDFDFDGDGDYDVTGVTSGTIQVVTSQLGMIRPAVRASGSGGSAVALGGVSLIVAANIPPVAILTADSLEGRILDGETDPFTVNFDAGESYDQDGGSLEYAFDLNGDGSLGAFNTDPLRQADYSQKGLYFVTLAVRDGAGLVDHAALVVSVRQVSAFRSAFVAEGLAYSSNEHFSLANIAGRPAVAFHSTGPDPGLYYVRAIDAEASGWAERILLDDSSGPSTGYFAKLSEINGAPAVAYADSNDMELRYIRAGNSTGQLASDWSNPPVDIGTSLIPNPNLIDMAFINGNPAVIAAYNNDLLYVRATGGSGTGNSAADWADDPFSVALAAGSISGNICLADVAGNPAVTYIYNSELNYKRATTSTGASALDWPVGSLVISGSRVVSVYQELLVADGNPAVAFHDTTTNSNVSYVRSNTALGNQLADWPNPVTVYDGMVFASQGYVNMALVDGRPAITHFAGTPSFPAVQYHHAEDAAGASWGGAAIALGGAGLPLATHNDLAEVDGLPVVLGAANSSLLLSSRKLDL